MKNFVYILFLIFISISCSNDSDKKIEKPDNFTFDYFNDCSDLSLWYGKIQGVTDNKLYKLNLFVLPLAECTQNQEYDIIWIPRNKIDQNEKYIDILTKSYESESETDYPSFESFVFTVAKVIDEKSGETTYKFPCDCSALQFKNKSWEFIKTQKVNNINELGNFKASIILQKSEIVGKW